MNKITINLSFNDYKANFHGNAFLRQLTFTLGHIRWGWTPPQFQNTYIHP